MKTIPGIECVTVGAIETNCWLFQWPADQASRNPNDNKPCIIIDPGDEAGKIISRLTELNWTPQFIFLTHGHFDHLTALPALLEKYRDVSGPKIGIHGADANSLGKDSLALHRESFIAAGGNAAYIDALWKPRGLSSAMPGADIVFKDSDSAGPFKVLHLPGHTPGSAAFYDEKGGVLFSGDTLFRGNCGRTDLPGGDRELLKKSLKRLLSLNEDTVVFPGHGPATNIKNEKKTFF